MGLAALGRVVATDAVTVIETRLTALAGTDSHATLGGVALRPGQWTAGRGTAAATTRPGNWATEPTVADRVAQAAQAQRGGNSRLSFREILAESAFHLQLIDTAGPRVWSVWG